jgi:8-oxo-dGTP diphosphatase
MLKYTFCLVKRGNEILLLNREKPYWMGCWNGIGGKLEQGEEPRESVMREIFEETGISDYRLAFKGLVTWTVDGSYDGGMYIYLAEVSDDYRYETPLKTDEGILDWKDIGWILSPDNLGIAENIPRCLEKVLFDSHCYDHHCTYEGGKLILHESIVIDHWVETDALKREQYLTRYASDRSGVR